MTLTKEDLQILQRPFPAAQHKFKQGRAYISEEAVLNRIEEVDPNWSWERIDVHQRDRQIIAAYRMTIQGNSKVGEGMALIEMTKEYTDQKTGEIKPARESNEAEKAAVTDALRRAARLYGIGRYLLNLPKDEKGNPIVNNVTALDKWLNQNYPQQPPANAPKPIQQATSSIENAPNSTNGYETPKTPETLLIAQPEQKSTTDKINVVWKKGDKRSFDVTALLTKLRNRNTIGVMLECRTLQNVVVESYTREPFREKGFDVTQWNQIGYEMDFPEPVSVIAEFTGAENDQKPGRWLIKEVMLQQPAPLEKTG
jgi:hypothetical protein